MKIRLKFFFINGVIFLTVIFISGLAIWSINENKKLDSTIESGIKLIGDVRKIHGLMKDIMFDIFTPQTYRLLKDLVYTPRLNTTIIDFNNEVEHFKSSYNDFINSSRVKKLLRDEELEDEYVTAQKMSEKAFLKIDSFRTGLKQVLEISNIGEEGIYKQIQTGNEKVVNEFFGDLRSTSYYLTNNFESFLNHFVNSLERESIIIRKQILYLFLVLTLLVGLFTVVLTLEFARRISSRLQKVENAFQKVSRGDFSVRLDIRTGDEFELLSNHLNFFIKKLKEKVDSVLELFEGAGSTITGKPGFQEIFGTVVKSAVNDSNSDGALILIHKKSLKMFSLSNSHISFFGKIVDSKAIQVFFKICDTVKFKKLLKEKSPFFLHKRDIQDYPEDIVFREGTPGSLSMEGISIPNSIIGLPLVISSGFIGNLLLIKAGENNSFTDLDFIHFITFAKYVSLSIDNFLKYKALLKKGEAEYKALQSQINPHFLYNVLNNFIGLNRLQERKLLEQAIFSLKDMLRYTLEQDIWTTVEKEFIFINKYCQLQQLRFQDRLELEVEYEPEIADYRIPKLILQPVVENAVIHGIEPLDRPGKLRVYAGRLASNGKKGLELCVEDDGQGFAEAEEDTEDIGLRNVKERLNLAYRNVSFNIITKKEKGTRVSIKIMN
ncbi:MAG: hypothetical protein DRP57_05415 [Spirochaetes bacterium]|nr:MAG: hypothetical protein DRP57_05415 [Spirochaetota bacterium]